MTQNLKTLQMNETSGTITKAAPWKYKLKSSFVIGFTYFHLAAAYGIYLAFSTAKWQTNLFAYIMLWVCGLGVYAGAHRLFSHRSYKATRPLQIFLMLCHSTTYQKSVSTWVLDHRLHHKYSDTDADPYNSSRGFFFSHIGWLLCKKHPEAVKRAGKIDMSDIESNPVLMFQKRYYYWVLPTFSFVIPSLVPMVFWNENFSEAWHVNIARYIISLHGTFLINSVAHKWGTKRYDQGIQPTQNFLIMLIGFGEAFHNYHHVFPYDYRGSEFGSGVFNCMKVFIDICAFFGLAYDLKTASKDLVKARMERTGDGSTFWGFDYVKNK